MSSPKKDKAAKKHKVQPQTEGSKRKSAYGAAGDKAICVNAQCKLRKEGCRGFEGCPGYKGRD